MPDFSNWPYPAPPPPPPRTGPLYLIGLDLGKTCDPTAIAFLEQHDVFTDAVEGKKKRTRRYDCRHLQRFPLGMPYPDIVTGVQTMLAGLPEDPRPLLMIDHTGVGKAVVDMFRVADLRARIIAVTFTGGHQVTGTADEPCVPKKDLVDAVKAILQTRRLEIARELPEGKVLKKELQSFAVKVTPAGREVFEAWREGQHDDLVFAVAMAAWWGENFGWRDLEIMWV